MSALLTLTATSAAVVGGAKIYKRRRHRRVFVTALQESQGERSLLNEDGITPANSLEELAHQSETLTQAVVTKLYATDEAYQWFVKTRIDPLFQGKRHAMLEALQLDDGEDGITPEERDINRKLAYSGAITVAAVVTAPLGFAVQFAACVPLAVYMVRRTYKRAYISVKEERKLTLPVLVTVNQALLWLGGFFTLGGVIFILTTTGEKISYITETRSRKQMVNIFGKLPRSVWVLQHGSEIKIPFDQLHVGDVLVIRTGQMIPIDGVIVAGYASIDQHRLTGESQPAEKAVGDTVLAATVVLAGRIHIEVEKTGEATVAAHIGDMLEKTASYQMSITTKSARIANSSVGPTLAVAALAGVVVGTAGAVAITSTMFGINLFISGPLALRNYLTVATRRSILVKDGRSLDLLADIDTIIFDKTGTLTLDQPHVTHVHAFTDLPAHDVLRFTAAVEQHQTHPIARAILTYADEHDLLLPTIEDTSYAMGYGLRAEIEGRLVRVGSDRFMGLEGIPLAPEVEALQEASHAQGHSMVMVAVDDEVVGAIELEPTIRPEAKRVIAELRERGLDFYIISGDQAGPTRNLAQSLGIDNYFANTLPENKAQLVEQLQAEGRAVCFVGDGINDSIALKKANVSISLRGSTTVAMDTAQVVLMDTTLEQLPLLFQLATEMDDNLELTRLLAIVPCVGIWGGVFFLNVGILGATLIFEASLWAGIANAMRPLLKYREEEEDEAPIIPMQQSDQLKQISQGEISQ